MKKIAEPDFKDPFAAGQMVGMLMLLMFIEKNNGMPAEAIDKIKWTCANNARHFLDIPTDDVFAFTENLLNEIEIL